MTETKLRQTLKAIRGSQPFNYVSTSLARACLRATGRQSDFLTRHLHRVGSVKCRLPNGRQLRLWSLADDWISNQIFWKGWDGYEPETTRVFFRMAARSRVTLDVGAYVGLYALLAAHANAQGQVYAFEPMPLIHERLLENVSLNKLSNVSCIRSAVGEMNGTAEFFHERSGLPSSSSLSSDFMESCADAVASTVEVVRIDDFVRDRQLPCVDLLKIDTESTEPQVLRGMTETLKRDCPSIICEVLNRQGSGEALDHILRPLGYRYYLLTGEGPVERDNLYDHPEYVNNYLFTTRSLDEIR